MYFLLPTRDPRTLDKPLLHLTYTLMYVCMYVCMYVWGPGTLHLKAALDHQRFASQHVATCRNMSHILKDDKAWKNIFAKRDARRHQQGIFDYLQRGCLRKHPITRYQLITRKSPKFQELSPKFLEKTDYAESADYAEAREPPPRDVTSPVRLPLSPTFPPRTPAPPSLHPE